jgi:imidazolonepropionase-like amidohydrolase
VEIAQLKQLHHKKAALKGGLNMKPKSPIKFYNFIFVTISILFLFQSAKASENYFIKAKKIYTVTKGIINDGMIEIKNGKIARIGQNISLPEKWPFISANVVIPGLIDIHSHIGVYSVPPVAENNDVNEMTNPITPQVRALDSFNFDDPAIAVARAAGVTTVVSRPGSANVIGGVSVAIKLKTGRPEEMILKEICDLKMAIEGNPVGVYGQKKQMPSTLMAVYFLARQAFLEARDYMEAWERYEKEKGNKQDILPPQRDLGKEMLVKALKREIPVHIHCATASEIMSSIRLADEFNLRLSLGHCYWAHLVIDELASRPDVYFNVGPPMFFTYYDNILEFKNTPALLANAGLKVSLQTDAIGGTQQNLLHLARLCYRFGMKEIDALKAITINAAEAVGLEKRIGSLEEGKDADLVLLDGDPMEFTTSVEKVIIDGKIEYSREKNSGPPTLTEIPSAKGSLAIPKEISDGPFAIKAGFLLTMAGEPLKDGVILIKNGKIENVGHRSDIPRGYKIIDASDFVVMPGLVCPRSYIGISSNWRQQSSIDEIANPITPELEVKHAIEPQAPHFTFTRQLGITTTMITPGNKNVIGGQGVVLKTYGNVVDKMIVKDRAIMVFGLGAQAKREDQLPKTRMGVAALLRETLTKAKDYLEVKQKELSEKEGMRKRDFSLEALIPVLKGEMPVLVHCERLDDIYIALRIADEFKIKMVIDGGTAAYKLADELKKREIPVIIEDLLRGTGGVEDKDFTPEAPAILSKAGVKIAFRAKEGTWYAPGVAWGGGDLLEIAAFAVKNGMEEKAALRAITIDAAKIIGVDNRVGSLEPKKDADILILRGHPFKTRSIAEAIFSDGKLIYQRKK